MTNFNPLEHDEKFRYMLLDRCRTDCNYFLGNGHRNEKDLWGLSVEEHIKVMKELWHSFPEDGKPEWLTLEQIEEYEAKMTTCTKKIPCSCCQNFETCYWTKKIGG